MYKYEGEIHEFCKTQKAENQKREQTGFVSNLTNDNGCSSV